MKCQCVYPDKCSCNQGWAKRELDKAERETRLPFIKLFPIYRGSSWSQEWQERGNDHP